MSKGGLGKGKGKREGKSPVKQMTLGSEDDTWDSAYSLPSENLPVPHKSAYKGPCYEGHQVIKILNGEFLGASCSNPVAGFDIYVGLDGGFRTIGPGYPWEPPSSTPEHQFLFHIADGSAPKDPVRFKAMITWLTAQLKAGKRIHAGCIGGHGRTGLLLAALIAEATGEIDAIAWTRKNHCEKAVESTAQVKFLMDHYGVKPAVGSKSHYTEKATTSSYSTAWNQSSSWYKGTTGEVGKPGTVTKGVEKKAKVYSYVGGRGNVWNI